MKTFQMNRLDSIGKLLTVFIVGVLSLLFSVESSAQSTNDWVGNRQLVDGNVAITRLKQAARTIVQQSNQQPPQQSTAVASGQGTDYHFILRVAEEIATNNRTSKEAINMVALALATEGVVTSELTRIAESLIAILS